MTVMQWAVLIDAPAHIVFDRASDFENAAEHLSAIQRVEMLTEGAVHRGTRFRETRVMFGKETTETMEVTRFDPPRLYELSAESCGVHFRSLFEFVPHSAEQTEARLSIDCQARTLMAKIMGFVMSPMMRKSMDRAIQVDMDDLKRVCETHGGLS